MPTVIQPRPFEPKKAVLVTAVLIAFFVVTYTRKPPARLWHWQGGTMGTTYSVKAVDPGQRINPDLFQQWQRDIDARLAGLNRQMSTWLPDSEISRFNRHASAEPFPVSADFAAVTRAALELASATGGAFDPTLDPLIELWGFGSQGPTQTPSADALADAKAAVGHPLVRVESNALAKSRAEVHLNLNAIAKGYGADAVLALFTAQGLTNVFVEVGGEVACLGHNLSGTPWRIGVDVPRPDLPPGERFAAILSVDRGGVATSGDYRNFITDATGAMRSHILDPATGEPAVTDLAAVTVIADTCMEADGLATALFVMGSDRAMTWLEGRTNIQVMLQVHGENAGDFAIVETPGFAAYRVEAR